VGTTRAGAGSRPYRSPSGWPSPASRTAAPPSTETVMFGCSPYPVGHVFCPARRTTGSPTIAVTPQPRGMSHAWLSTHSPAEAGRPHVGPDLFDVREAFGPGPAGAVGPPAGRKVPTVEPDRILLLVVDHHLIRPGVVILGDHLTSVRSVTAPSHKAISMSRA